MLRRLLNSVAETTLQPLQWDAAPCPCPFAKKETMHFGWLTSVAPCFPVSAKNIMILNEPRHFYNILIEKCSEARHRITLVSLYLGNGVMEQKLVDSLLNNKHFKNGTMKINILLDYTRGSRYQTNSRVVLQPLIEENKNCHISLYHTPVLRGLRKKFTPDRFNELYGLQHMKLYIFDDTLIISGANLSNDYFTNRQDRYFVIQDKDLCNFYCGLVNRVQQFSLQMDRNNNLSLNYGWTQLPYEGHKWVFVDKARDLVETYLAECRNEQNNHKREGFDTWVFPLVQMGQFGVEQDAVVTARIIAEAPPKTNLYMATGYFNLTQQYMDTIIYNSAANCRILMAHPDANGFQGASFPAGGIPAAYSLIANKFKKTLEALGQSNRVTLQEYLRKGWTYHAKGLWYYASGEKLPCLTLIGSPNFGERSVKRDLETQVAVVTENKQLKEKLHRECTRLYELGLPADNSRTIPKWIYPMVFLFRGYF